MKKIFAICLLVLLAQNAVNAQSKRDLFIMSRGNSVTLFLTVPPATTEGFQVYRKGPLPSDGEFELLTKDGPVKPVTDPDEARAILGEDWPFVVKAVGVDEPFEVLRKLRGDEFAGGLISLLSLRAARVTGRWFLDTTAQQDKEYLYKVSIVDGRGKEKEQIQKQITVKDQFPAAPTKLKLKAGDGKATLSWDYPAWKGGGDDLAVQFIVYRRGGAESFRRINPLPIVRNDASPRQYEDLWLSNGAEYEYYVTAVDPVNRESNPSDTARITPKDNMPPDIPRGIKAEAGDGVVLVSWNMNPELDAAGYNVYRSLGLDKEFQKINTALIPVNSPLHFDSTAENGVQYFYAVSAIDKSGNESKQCNPSSAIGVDKTPPDPPKDLTYKVEKRVLRLSWTAAKATDLAGYYIYRGESEKIQPRITPKAVTDLFYADSGYQQVGMTPGKSFLVSVVAVDKARNESERVTVTVKIPDDDPPLAPRSVIAENIEGRYVQISCAGSPSLDVASYKLFRADLPGDDTELAVFASAPFNFRDSAIAKGHSFAYTAIAIDSAGNTSVSSIADSVTVRDFSPPPSPRNVTVKAVAGGLEIVWEKVIDFDLVGYNIYRADIPTGVYTKLNEKPLTELKYLDAGGKATDYYKVRSLDTSGNESSRSEAVHAR